MQSQSTLPSKSHEELNQMTVKDLTAALKGDNVAIPSRSNKSDLVRLYLTQIGAPMPTSAVTTSRAKPTSAKPAARQPRTTVAKSAASPRSRAIPGAPGLQGMTVAQMKDTLKSLGQPIPANPRREDLIEKLVATGQYERPPETAASPKAKTTTAKGAARSRGRPKTEGGDSYESMTVAQLKEVLKSRGLPYTGKKQELIDRLQGMPNGQSANVPSSRAQSDSDEGTPQPKTPPVGEIPVVPLNMPPPSQNFPTIPSHFPPSNSTENQGPSLTGYIPPLRTGGLSPLRGSQTGNRR